MTPTDELDYHDNYFLIELAKHLGLNPAQITNMEARGSADDQMVEVFWHGYATITLEDFNLILANVDQHKVTGSQL